MQLRRLATTPRARRLVSSLSDGAFALLSAAKPVAIGYAITCGIAFVAQRKLQYFPTVDAPELPSGDFSFAAVEEFEVFARDGTRCLGWRMPAPARGAEPVAPWWLGEKAAAALLPTMRELRRRYDFSHIDVLQFHGNAGSRANRLGWMHILREGLGCSVSVLD